MTERSPYLSVAALVLLVVPSATFAGSARPGWSKAVIWSASTESRVTRDQVDALGAEHIRDYDSFAVIRVPALAVPQAAAAAQAMGLRLEMQEHWDKLLMPGETVDTRAPVLRGQGRLEKYASDEGLFVVQFDGPLTPDMEQQLVANNLLNVGYVPYNGALVFGKLADVTALGAAPEVQFTSIYQPLWRAQPKILRPPEEARTLLVQLVDAPGHETTLARLRSASVGQESSNAYLRYRNVWIQASSAIIPDLLADPYVVAIEYPGVPTLSGEREAIAVTTKRAAPPPTPEPYQDGVRPYKPAVPTPAPDYRTWLSNRGVLDTSGYRIAFVDTGLPGGTSPHQDINNGRSIVYLNYTTDPDNWDKVGHGTAVSSMALGDSVSGSAEPTPTPSGVPFYWGMGIAPRTKALSQKVTDGWTPPSVGVLTLTRDANNQGCKVQNHSMNDYDQSFSGALCSQNPTNGTYKQKSQEFDEAVRDGDIYAAGEQPMAITVSAGNRGGVGIDDCTMVAPPATAKNVLSVGATQSFRTFLGTCWQRGDPTEDMLADSFKNVASFSRRGTADGRIKPDIVAPGGLVSFASTYGCFPVAGQPYGRDSGTSFAAPQAAASYVLLMRKRNTVFSPAMLKAAIVGNALSLMGGNDFLPDPEASIAARPNPVQGFGRLYLGDALATSGVTQTYLDETDWTPFTSAGQTRSRTMAVVDTSKPAVIVVAWTDAAAVVDAPVTLVRDINMWISWFPNYYTGNQITVNPQTLEEESLRMTSPVYDYRNNVEMIIIPRYTLSTFVLRLTTLTWGAGWHDQHNQKFAVFASNAQ